MRTMKTVCFYGYGGPDVLVQEEAPCPRAGGDDVLVRVHAAAINPIDWRIREGQFKDTLHHTLPLVPGWDVSGVVEGVGPRAVRFKVGDEIYCRSDILRDGAYAEFVVIREAELAAKPRSVDHVHAAALPQAGLAAWQSLFVVAGLTSGQRVLIHGAAGGVGHLAVQMAKGRGAFVVGTASPRDHGFLRKLGIDKVVDYATARFEDVVEDVDVVLDTVGGEVQDRSLKVLKRGGILVSLVSRPSPAAAAEHGVREVLMTTEPNAEQLGEISKLVDSGSLQVRVETVLPLSEAKKGQELSRRGHMHGKVVLQLVPPPRK